MYCPECGTKNEDVAQFCENCGTAIVEKPNISNKLSSGFNKLVANATEKVKELKGNIDTTEIQNINTEADSINTKCFCRNCGKEVEKDAYACLGCGLPPLKAFNFCPNCGSNCHNEAVICINCGIQLDSKEDTSKLITTERKRFCRNCSNEVHLDAIVCLKCGLEPNKSKNFCPSCSTETHNDAVLCINCGCKLDQFTKKEKEVAQSVNNTESVSKRTVSNNVVIVGNQKSVGTAFILAFLFGPLGLLYASTAGGIIMFFVGLIVGFVTLGIGLIFTWIICIIWAVIAVQNSNKSAMERGANMLNNNIN